jgi:Mn-dependent DtxR family transcriptional regulator
MSTKSISGVLDRGKRAGLIKLNGNKAYELTAKGMKIALPNANGEAAHG